MGFQELVVTLAGLALIAFLGWYFFGPKTARQAELRGGVQEVEITVKGGYSPDVIQVREGMLVRLIFNRQESSDCTARVVEFVPNKSGRFGFACGMNMLHGTLVVRPDSTGAPVAEAVLAAGTPPPAGAGAHDEA